MHSYKHGAVTLGPKQIGLAAVSLIGLVTILVHVHYSKTPNSLAAHRQSSIPYTWDHDPNKDPTGEPWADLRRVKGDNYAPNNPKSDRINATLMSLVRNRELDALLQSMNELERTWNHKFNYPWTFFNEEPFTDEFKARTQAATKAECRYEFIGEQEWQTPSWINQDIFAESSRILMESDVPYANMLSYRQMCRWNSGVFYHHPALKDMQYYWRVEPNVHFYCDIDYDVFRFMQDSNKTYGFTVSLYDSPPTVRTLWPETLKFISTHPDYLHPNSAIEWLTDRDSRPQHNIDANGYSTCHFWSNFEIASLDFWRSPAYTAYFDHLDRAGGFFYERWGDAPVHSVGIGLFEDKDKIHWFKDIGYNHIPFYNCPNSPKCKGCDVAKFFEGESFLAKEDCRPNWFKFAGMGKEWQR